jgi:hypothetical protein
MMHRMLVLLVALTLAGCGGGASGPIGGACIRSDRAAANPALCSCIQRVAGQSLSGADQRRAAEFFGNPDKAERVRRSDADRDDAFWDRYRAFANRAAAVCG